MGTHALPDMYTLNPRASGTHIRQSTRAHVITITCAEIHGESSIFFNIYIYIYIYIYMLSGNIILYSWPVMHYL